MKKKGTRAERELFHMLWNANFCTVRSAGSGSTTLPSPDLITSNTKKTLAIECKALKGTTIYFKEGEIKQLTDFSNKFGADPWVGVKFNNKGWFFIHARDIEKTKNRVDFISLTLAQKKGIRFEDLIKDETSNLLRKVK